MPCHLGFGVQMIPPIRRLQVPNESQRPNRSPKRRLREIRMTMMRKRMAMIVMRPLEMMRGMMTKMVMVLGVIQKMISP